MPSDSIYQLTWPDTTRLDAMLWPIGLAAGDLITSRSCPAQEDVPAVHGCFLISPRTSAAAGVP